MLLSEDPAALIAHTINNFNINPDKVAVARIGESISTLQQARDLRIKESVAALKKLSRAFNTLQSQHEDLAATHSAAAHAAEIARLDTQKFRTAKAAADADAEVERLAQQAADLEARLQELEAQGVEGGPEAGAAPGAGTAAEDEVLLRLKVYRSLGIQIERGAGDDDQAGPAAAGFTKAVIRNDRLGDVHVVNLDKKFSPFFYANFFWQTV